jgi:hypothetical protein
MQARVALAILLVAIGFYVYSVYTIRKEAFTYAEAVSEPTEPSAPPAVIQQEVLPSVNSEPITTRETAMDPTETQYESAQIPQRMRHPENSFSPGYVNDDTDITQASGVAGKAMLATENAEQTFGAEMIQNGGEFMRGGVMANDDSWNVSYSSI